MESVTQRSMSIAGKSLKSRMQSLNSAVRRRSLIWYSTAKPRQMYSVTQFVRFVLYQSLLLLTYTQREGGVAQQQLVPQVEDVVQGKHMSEHREGPEFDIR